MMLKEYKCKNLAARKYTALPLFTQAFYIKKMVLHLIYDKLLCKHNTTIGRLQEDGIVKTHWFAILFKTKNSKSTIFSSVSLTGRVH